MTAEMAQVSENASTRAPLEYLAERVTLGERRFCPTPHPAYLASQWPQWGGRGRIRKLLTSDF